jgi:hypothetical protein
MACILDLKIKENMWGIKIYLYSWQKYYGLELKKQVIKTMKYKIWS